jgi:hypothetical protein
MAIAGVASMSETAAAPINLKFILVDSPVDVIERQYVDSAEIGARLAVTIKLHARHIKRA